MASVPRKQVVVDHPDLASVYHDETEPKANHSLVSAPGASLCIVVTRLAISNGATGGSFKLVEDPAGTPAQKTGTIYLGANGHFEQDLHLKLTANKALGFTSVDVTTHSVYVEYHTEY